MNAKRQRGQPRAAALNPNAETASQQGPPDGVERRNRISVAAYYNAERRGFRNGGELDDWLAAERQIDSNEGKAGPRSHLLDDLGSPDHMIPREPLPAGNPHDPSLPGRARADRRSKNPERKVSKSR